ncbi:hypothetical protein ABEG63_06780 [Chryseobacterium sp. C39-AII1]|uniref:hypothetical protein n=1 Tax=Chryseobacterium sp. C39-AII1 TaxID=3080332 RepID=UPI0032091DAE
MKNFLCFILLIISCLGFAQKENIKEDSIFYERIYKLNQERDEVLFSNSLKKHIPNKKKYAFELNKNNLENYNEFLRTFPNSEYTFSALNGKAYTELQLKKYNAAKETFLTTLKFISDNKGKNISSMEFFLNNKVKDFQKKSI